MVDNEIARQRNKAGFQLSDFFERTFLNQKLNNVAGMLLVTLIATGFGYLVAKQTFIGMGLFAVIVGFFTVAACMMSAELGLYINIFYSFFAFGVARYIFGDAFPTGVGTDVLVLATFFSLLIHKVNLRKAISQFLHSPVVIAILAVVAYLFVEVFNPYADSVEGWFQTFRRFIESVLILFIAYNVFTDRAAIARFAKVLFAFCTIAGLYGCIQQWHGLFDFEIAWVMATENRFGLIFINGNYRKFSTMSDPTAYGIAMAAAAVFFMIIAWNQKKAATKAILGIGILFMLLGMAYSGTRTANAMVAVGLAMYILLTMNKRSTKVFAVVAGLAFLFLLYAPIYSNPTINRFRTSFNASEDESFKVREVNRKFIQPYIYSHPIGWGLGTTGAQGLMYNPGHFLAGFPPDSGYLKKAIETGWIGLALICALYFVVMRFGIRGYFRSGDERSRVWYAAALAAIFAFYIAEFPQEAIGQITDIVIYYPLIAMMMKLREFDRKEATEKAAAALPE